MLELSACYAEVGSGCLGILQRVLCFDHRDPIANAGVVLSLRIVQSLLVGFNGLVIEGLQRVLAANFEEGDGQVSLFGEALVLQIGGAELCGLLLLVDRIANLTPEIRLPRNI